LLSSFTICFLYFYLDENHTKTLTQFLETVILNPFFDLKSIKMSLLKMFQ
jgi:hypothetical protein